jgi:hypothetical protein
MAKTRSLRDCLMFLTLLFGFLFPAGVSISSAEEGGQPIKYSTVWTDKRGTRHNVVFDGSTDRGKVTGSIRVGQSEFQVDATMAAGKLSGTVRDHEGTDVATFSGGRTGDGMVRGTADLGTSVQAWELPARLFGTAQTDTP